MSMADGNEIGIDFLVVCLKLINGLLTYYLLSESPIYLEFFRPNGATT